MIDQILGSEHFLVWGMNVLLQVTLLTAVSLSVSSFIRRRPAVRYWVLFAAMLLILICPALVSVMQISGTGLLTVQLPKRADESEDTGVAANGEKRRPVIYDSAMENTHPGENPGLAADPFSNSTTHPGAFQSTLEPIGTRPETVSETESPIDPAEMLAVADLDTLAKADDSFSSWLLFVMKPFIAVWLVVALYFTVRLFVCWARMAWILQTASTNVSQTFAEAFQRACDEIGFHASETRPQLVLSEHVSGPVAAGILKPRVVLPVQFLEHVSSAQLHDVLMHEIAHIARRDQIVVLLQNLVGAVLWIHPLVKLLNRQLAQAREEVCDNYVLAATDAPSYGRTLLTLAELVQSNQPMPGAIGLYTSKWKLEHRIAGLLDEHRHRVTRLSSRGLLAVATLSGILAAFVSLSTVSLAIGESDERKAEPDSNRVQLDFEPDRGSSVSPDQSGQMRRRFTGTVVDAKGHPVVADIHLLGLGHWPNMTFERIGISKSDGTFDITYANENEYELEIATIYITAKGHGPDWSRVSELKHGMTFTLGRDTTEVAGTLMDLEGRPVANATVQITRIDHKADNDLSQYIEVVKAGNGSNYRFDKSAFKPPFPAVTTNEKGQFRFTGIGDNRRIKLKIVGKSIAQTTIDVITMMSPTIRNEGDDDFHDDAFTYGATFQHIAKPSRIVRGTVVSKETREPVAGAFVSTLGTDARAETDKDGRFELIGLAKNDQYPMTVWCDDGKHLVGSKMAADTDGFGPMDVELTAPRGITIRGKIVDANSGQPIKAKVSYYPIYPNDQIAEGDGYREVPASGNWADAKTDADGSFEIAAFPGPGFLGVRAQSVSEFQTAHVDAAAFFQGKIAYGGQLSKASRTGSSLFVTSGKGVGAMPQSNWQGIKLLMIDPADGDLQCDIKLVRAKQVGGHVVDSDGRPIHGIRAYGNVDGSRRPSQLLADGKFQLRGIGANEKRRITFLHKRRKLVATSDIAADDPQPLEITAQPWGEVKGRMLDEDGEPLGNLLLFSSPNQDEQDIGGHLHEPQTTDKDGRFHIRGLVPGRVYRLRSHRRYKPQVKVTIQSNQVLDVGDVRGIADPISTMSKTELKPVAAPISDSQIAESERAECKVVGTVRLPNGKPVAGAFVSLTGTQLDGSLHIGSRVLDECVTDNAGRYEFTLSKTTAKKHTDLKVIARTESSGIAWQRVDLTTPPLSSARVEVGVLTLPNAKTLKARMVNLEGQPISGLSVTVWDVVKTKSAPGRVAPEDRVSLWQLNKTAKAWIQDTKTNSDGYLSIHHVPEGFGVRLRIDGTDQFAPQGFAIGTGDAEERSDRDATYRDTVRNADQGEIVTLPVAPAQPFEGIVLLGDSDKPAANSKVEVWASQQEFGSMMSVFGETNSHGHFKLTPYPGVRFGIKAYPPDGEPYHIKRLQPLRWSSGDASRNLEIRLPQGVLAQGTVVDEQTGQPIVHASVQYVPTSKTASKLSDEVVTGWQSIKKTDAEGRFRIAVAPGEATLLVHAAEREYVLKMKGSQEISRGNGTGGTRYYAHAFHRINPVEGGTPPNLRIELTPGNTVAGKLIGPSGEPIDRALIISRLKIAEHSPTWRGFTDEAVNGAFRLTGLADDNDYRVSFLDPKNKWGATVLINTKNPNPTIQLQPCGQAAALFVDQNDNATPGVPLHMIVSEGKPRYGMMRSGSDFFADEDFVVNIDRTNHRTTDKPNGEQVIYPALIPDARYRIDYQNDEGTLQHREFVAKSGETIDLGKFSVKVDD